MVSGVERAGCGGLDYPRLDQFVSALARDSERFVEARLRGGHRFSRRGCGWVPFEPLQRRYGKVRCNGRDKRRVVKWDSKLSSLQVQFLGGVQVSLVVFGGAF